MGFWVVENATGLVKDYSADGSIQYDARFHATHQDLDLPAGDQARQYFWDGAKIVKRPPDQRTLDLAGLKTTLDALVGDALTPQKLKDFAAALRKIL